MSDDCTSSYLNQLTHSTHILKLYYVLYVSYIPVSHITGYRLIDVWKSVELSSIAGPRRWTMGNVADDLGGYASFSD